MPTVENPGTADADLVTAALTGDRDAFAAIYDRYTDRIHTMCVHMLGDRDEAADVCGEVFLVAFQRLAQLKDPARLRPWLYAICRHEVYRRTKRRRRVELVEEVNEMDRIAARDVDGTDEPDLADHLALARLVHEAAGGLDDRDRMVLELQLQGIEGAELAAALGTSISTSYQHVHRMRERMERSLGALLVARRGRAECSDLDRLLSGWDGGFSVLWRKRVARHVDGCETCERRRKAVPGTLLGTAGASPLVSTPTSVRERVLGAVTTGDLASTPRRRGWRRDGFPPAADDRRHLGAIVVAAIVLALLGLGLWAVLRSDADAVAASDAVAIGSTTTSAVSTTTVSATMSLPATVPVPPTFEPAVVPWSATPTTVPTTTRATSPTTATPTTAKPTTTTNATTTSTSTTTTTTVAAPQLRLSGPAAISARASNDGTCSNGSFIVTVTSGSPTSVSLRWSVGSSSGTVAMGRDRRVGNRWTAIIDPPFGTSGTLSATASASVPGSPSGASNVATATVSPCPVIG